MIPLKPKAINPYLKSNQALKLEAEILALPELGGLNPGVGERSITKREYQRLISNYKNLEINYKRS